MKQFLIKTILISFSFIPVLHAQDDLLPPPSEAKNEPKNEESKSKRGDELFFGISQVYGYRTLKERPSVFGDPLGIRAEETPSWQLSAEIGYRIKMKHYFSLIYGLEFNQIGVSYNNTSDSSFLGYTLKKQSIVIPVRVNFQKGENFVVHFGLGAAPKMFFNGIYTERLEDNFGKIEEISTNQKDPYNGMNLDLLCNIGARWNFGESFGVYFIPEFRYELFDTYKVQEPHVQHFYGLYLRWGVNVLF